MHPVVVAACMLPVVASHLLLWAYKLDQTATRCKAFRNFQSCVGDMLELDRSVRMLHGIWHWCDCTTVCLLQLLTSISHRCKSNSAGSPSASSRLGLLGVYSSTCLAMLNPEAPVQFACEQLCFLVQCATQQKVASSRHAALLAWTAFVSASHIMQMAELSMQNHMMHTWQLQGT